MVDEKDEAYGQEEGEYHFSDEHASYEVEPETTKVDTTAKSAGAAMAGFTQYRRVIIGGIVAFVALLAVYRMLMPGYTPQATDFTQATSTAPAKPTQLAAEPKPVTAPLAPVNVTAPQVQPQQIAAAPTQPAQQPGALPPVSYTHLTLPTKA